MAGTSTKTKPVTVRLPVDLVDWIATQEGSTGDVVVRALTALRDGPAAGQTEQLQAQVAYLTEDRDLWRTRAKAIVGAADKPAKRGSDPMGRRQHPAGPVLQSAVPGEVSGSVEWCGLKGHAKL